MRTPSLATACRKLIPLLILAVASGCGGGGGGGSSGGGASVTPPATTPVDTTPAVSAPSISVQPASASISAGGSVTFSVTAGGTAPLSYQWQHNGSDIAGATSAQYTLAAAQANDDGSLWTVIVRNSAGSVTSAAAKLTVVVAGKSLLAGAIASNGFSGYVDINGIAVDNNGVIYLSDRGDDTHLRVVTQQGVSHKLALTVSAGDATAPLSQVAALARDAAGYFYATDRRCAIHKISPDGLVTILAGSANCGAADAKGIAASFDSALAITVDAGGTVYVGGGATIRKITADGTVTTLAGIAGTYGTVDGNAGNARFGGITGIAVDAAGAIFVADSGSNSVSSRIRKLSPAGIVSTVAGGSTYGAVDGPGAVATFNSLNGLTIDKQGNLFVADERNHAIRKITPAGIVSTLAGSASQTSYAAVDGTGAAAQFNLPYGMTTDSAGNVYVVDANAGLAFNAVRKITPGAEVTTITGNNAGTGTTDGPAAAARFNRPEAIAVHSDGTVFVADTGNQLIRRISAAGSVITVAGDPGHAFLRTSGDGTGTQANFFQPDGIAVGADGVAYVADAVRNTIRRVGVDGVVTTFAGNFQSSSQPADGLGASASFSSVNSIAIDRSGVLYVADDQAVRKVDASGNVTTLAGTLGPFGGGTADGNLAQARFGYLTGIAVDASGNVYLADARNQNIRKISPAGVVTTLAGATGVTGAVDGQGSAASFNGPRGIAVDQTGNVYVADTENNLIRRIDTSGAVTTVAGKRGLTGNELGALDGALNRPMGLAFDVNGNLLVTSGNGVFRLPL